MDVLGDAAVGDDGAEKAKADKVDEEDLRAGARIGDCGAGDSATIFVVSGTFGTWNKVSFGTQTFNSGADSHPCLSSIVFPSSVFDIKPNT